MGVNCTAPLLYTFLKYMFWKILGLGMLHKVFTVGWWPSLRGETGSSVVARVMGPRQRAELLRCYNETVEAEFLQGWPYINAQ